MSKEYTIRDIVEYYERTKDDCSFIQVNDKGKPVGSFITYGAWGIWESPEYFESINGKNTKYIKKHY